MKPRLIIIAGPTAVGKSDISIELARKIDGEIISADSVQIYRGMDIGSAKIKPEEMKGVKHHLIDCLNPDEDFGVNVFQSMASDAAKQIEAAGKIPILVGGTAFYTQALLYGIDFDGEADHDDSYRNELTVKAENEAGRIKLHEMLESIDPAYAAITHYNNSKRVIRALEYYRYTGELFSEYNKREREKEAIYDAKYFAITDDRDVLYERINKRVDVMIEEGLIEEVKKLREAGYSDKLPSMQSIGYKEINSYLNHETALDEAIALIKQNTRHLAKRQLTWLRRERDVIWIDRQTGDVQEKIYEHL